MHGVVKALASKDKVEFDAVWADAQQELEVIFAPDVWGIKAAAQEYTSQNYSTVWNHEMRRPVRALLEAGGGVTADDLAGLARGMLFVNVAIYRRFLFDTYQENRGWRVLLLGVPSVDVGVFGFALHYQNAQNHDHLAQVSALLYDQVAAAAQAHDLPLPGRKIQKADWTDDSLFPREIPIVSNVSLSPLSDQPHLLLKDVRITTLKKILASMISVKPFDLMEPTGADLSAGLPQIEAIGRVLAVFTRSRPSPSSRGFAQRAWRIW